MTSCEKENVKVSRNSIQWLKSGGLVMGADERADSIITVINDNTVLNSQPNTVGQSVVVDHDQTTPKSTYLGRHQPKKDPDKARRRVRCNLEDTGTS